MTREGIRTAILLFDKERGETGRDYVSGVITRVQADSEYEYSISKLMKLIDKYTEAKVLEARIEELDVTYEPTLDPGDPPSFREGFSYAIQYVLGSNHRRIAQLQSEKEKL